MLFGIVALIFVAVTTGRPVFLRSVDKPLSPLPPFIYPREITNSGHSTPDISSVATPETSSPEVTAVPQESSGSMMCINMAQATNGSFSSLQNATHPKKRTDVKWKAHSCEIPVVDDATAEKCHRSKKILLIGDSMADSLYTTYNSHAVGWGGNWKVAPIQLEGDLARIFYGTIVPNWKEKVYHDSPAPEDGWVQKVRTINFITPPWIFSDQKMRDDMSQADHIIVTTGMWDMGRHFCSPVLYYKNGMQLLAEIKKYAKKDAVLAVRILHWLVRKPPICRPSDPCFTCNEPPKIKIFQEAQTMMATCLGLEIIEDIQLKKAGTDYTNDGLHYWEPVQNATINIYRNMICGNKMKFTPKLLSPEKVCNPQYEQEMFKRWMAVPEAGWGCLKNPPEDYYYRPGYPCDGFNITSFPNLKEYRRAFEGKSYYHLNLTRKAGTPLFPPMGFEGKPSNNSIVMHPKR